MEKNKELRNNLRRLEDVVDIIETKLHNTVGIIELLRLGMERLYNEDSSYEISTMSILKEYLSAINNTEITKIQIMLNKIKEQL